MAIHLFPCECDGGCSDRGTHLLNRYLFGGVQLILVTDETVWESDVFELDCNGGVDVFYRMTRNGTEPGDLVIELILDGGATIAEWRNNLVHWNLSSCVYGVYRTFIDIDYVDCDDSRMPFDCPSCLSGFWAGGCTCSSKNWAMDVTLSGASEVTPPPGGCPAKDLSPFAGTYRCGFISGSGNSCLWRNVTSVGGYAPSFQVFVQTGSPTIASITVGASNTVDRDGSPPNCNVEGSVTATPGTTTLDPCDVTYPKTVSTYQSGNVTFTAVVTPVQIV